MILRRMGNHARSNHVDLPGRTFRQIDRAPRNEGTAVIDPDIDFFPFNWFRTRTHVLNGSERCAAVILFLSNVSPLAVFRPWYGSP